MFSIHFENDVVHLHSAATSYVYLSQVSYRFLALGCFPANLVSDEKEQKKQKIETVNSYIKNLLTDTCESRHKVCISL